MTRPIAIIGMACRYPDTRTPEELWENVVSGRRAFRRMPDERLRLADYHSSNRAAPDRMYSTQAALVEGFEFDRVAFRVAGSTFRAADPAHWLALDVASRALADAGYADGEGLRRATTGVILGNTLTGDASRANTLRLRWPYVRRTVEAALEREGFDASRRRALLERLEVDFKEPFPPIGEESLAGGLSNTIAGRICNHFDLHGGGFVVDGACAASLLAVTQACAALDSGDLDVALAGGVDLSLDPFELVGFAKAGALAADEMRVFDRHPTGFLPGEGCGFVVLARLEDALTERRHVHALVRGWGVSSDGSGGLTRPEVEGQMLALRRAYARAGFGIDTVDYVEGHGTGTEVGDATELESLTLARREAGARSQPAAIGSIKALIGHTKAAAGIAGLIKATMAVREGVLPPTTGCVEPHALLVGEDRTLRALAESEPWPTSRPRRAGVSAMGFGGINTHVVIESATNERGRVARRVPVAPDAELFAFGAANATLLRRRVEGIGAVASRLSRAEMGDLAVALARTLERGVARAAVVASTPGELAERLETLVSWLERGETTRLDGAAGTVFLGIGDASPRIGFLFPGQGSSAHVSGGAWRRRFDDVRDLYARFEFPSSRDAVATEIAQPAIVVASLAGLRVLRSLGIEADVAVGHSLGELVALHWGGALDEEAVVRVAAARGRAMADLVGPKGAMASLDAGAAVVETLLSGTSVVVAGRNGPRHTVVSGETTEIERVLSEARARGIRAVRLAVSHAFHSPLVVAAAPLLADRLARETLRPIEKVVFSTVSGARLGEHDDLRALLVGQVTSPVLFADAFAAAQSRADLWIEVGPGHVLAGLAADQDPDRVSVPVFAIDAGGPSLRDLLAALGAAFALGARLDAGALVAGRFARAFPLPPEKWQGRFFASPCESAPLFDAPEPAPRARLAAPALPDAPHSDALSLVRRLVAVRAELPDSAVVEGSRLLDDLHLNSIAVAEIVIEAARQLGLAPPVSPQEFADATVGALAHALESLAETGGTSPVADDDREPPGVDSWVRAFTREWVERRLVRGPAPSSAGTWRVIAPVGHPLAGRLREALDRGEVGSGIAVCLPRAADESSIALLLEGARAALDAAPPQTFLLVQPGGGAASFARTLHLEARGLATCVVDAPEDELLVDRALAEVAAAHGFVEARYDSGRRLVPVLRPATIDAHGDSGPLALGPSDVLLVTGGGKGIAAECALALARESRCRLVLVGRSQPDGDAELARNLERFRAAGLDVRYVVADVADGEAVSRALAGIGPVTGILHGAGTNTPRLIRALDEEAIRRTVDVKVGGLRHVLEAIDASALRLLVTFGSLVALTGLRGEADYALANEWLARETGRIAQAFPACRCLTVEWSLWSGVGMGERLGRVEALAREGLVAIPPDVGVAWLRRLLGAPLAGSSVVVTGRFGRARTLEIERPELPLRRFLERTRAHAPGIELIVDAELSADSDPYLEDHVFRGSRLFPAVMALEAMAQTAAALVGVDEAPVFENVVFDRPVAVPARGRTTIRIAALAHAAGRVDVVVRSDATGFQVDHFRATCRFGVRREDRSESATTVMAPPVPVNPERDLYGGLLFQGERFRRLRGYRQLSALACLAEIAPDGDAVWFGRYLPASMVLGDSAARDAVLHAVQACVPQVSLLPVGFDRMVPGTASTAGPIVLRARERTRVGDTFTYDLEVSGPDGAVRERWEGVRYSAIPGTERRARWVAPLLGPWVERRVSELIPGASPAVAVDSRVDGEPSDDRRARSDRAIQRAVGQCGVVRRRSDGKPEIGELVVDRRGDGRPVAAELVTRRHDDDRPDRSEIDRCVTAAHAGPLTLALAGEAPLGCDLEAVSTRLQSTWRGLLGSDRFALAETIARETGEDVDRAATRVWSAGESMKKAGAAAESPLVFRAAHDDGWVVLASGALTVATVVVEVRGVNGPIAIAVVAEGV